MSAILRMPLATPAEPPRAGRPRASECPRLTRRNREIYVARFVEGRTVRAIAEEYGLSERQVFNILRYVPRPRLNARADDEGAA